MERFIAFDITTDELEHKITEGLEQLAAHRENLRVNVVGLDAAFDMAEMIIRNAKTEPDWYIENTGPGQKAEKFAGNVLDAWSNISMLQDEIGANKLSHSLVNMMDALQFGEMSQDDFNTNVKNAATA